MVTNKMMISFSNKSYEEELKRQDFCALMYSMSVVYVDIDEMIKLISLGHCWTNTFIAKTRRSKDTFCTARCIAFDVKGSKEDMESYIQELRLKPTIAHTLRKEGTDGLHYFRLIYCFDTDIYKTDYPTVYNNLMSAVGVPKTSNNTFGSAMTMLYEGNNQENYKLYRSDIVYRKSDLLF